MIQIRELFDHPVSYTPLKGDEVMYSSTFKIEEYTYEFLALNQYHDHVNRRIGEDVNAWEVKFKIKSMKSMTGYELSNTGNASLVFSTVAKIIQKFLKMEKPEYWYFDADKDEPSRVKLYRIFAQAISKLDSNYRLMKEYAGQNYSSSYFLFKRK